MKFEAIFIKRMSDGAIAKYSDFIKAGIALAFGEYGTPSLVTNMLAEVHGGKLQAWVILGKVADATHPLGLITTRIINDERWGRRALYIETMNALEQIPRIWWERGVADLAAFAKENECDTIEADINNDNMLSIINSLGFVTTGHKVARAL